MKITNLQLRKLIREALLKERPIGLHENWEAYKDSIMHVLWENMGGMSGMELVAAVQNGYNWHTPPSRNDIFSVLDNLIEEEEVTFNAEEDIWTISDRGDYYDYMAGFKS
jgi:hypothetical protein